MLKLDMYNYVYTCTVPDNSHIMDVTCLQIENLDDTHTGQFDMHDSHF